MDKIEGKNQRWKAIIGLILLIIILTAIEVVIYQVRTQINIAHNVLVLVALNINIILLVVIILMVLRNLVKLYFERKQNMLGAKFRTKLIISFVGLSLIPCVLLFLVASNLINTSIDNWFNAQNEEYLRKAMKVAQIYYNTELGKVFGKSRELGRIIKAKDLIQESRRSELLAGIQDMQQKFGFGTIKVFGARGEEIIHLDNPKIPHRFLATALKELVARALRGQEHSIVRKTEQGDFIEGAVPIVSREKGGSIIGVLVFSHLDPHRLMEEIKDIKSAYEEYKQRKVFETPIKSSYIITFLLITLLIIFSATWFGFYLARGITIPIQKLAEGTRKVALGNWDCKVTVQADDEIGMLVNSFNNMTDELKSTHQRLQTINQELDRRRDYIETVLENIASGVVTIGQGGLITTINKAAAKILRLSQQEVIGVPYQEIFNCSKLQGLYLLLAEVEEKKKGICEKEVNLQIGGASIHLLVSVSVLLDKENQYSGLVCAFDDLTQLIKAQKVAAWQEVARRLAHEIKNPLTPIQLCTQRLRKRFFEGGADYQAVFDECTETIIQEVNELKTMIDEFSQFARLPLPNLRPEDLNHLIGTVIARYQEMYPEIQIEQHLASDLPLINLDREQMKRVFINLFDNAIEAMAEISRAEKKLTVVSIYDRIASRVRVEVIDNGKGISAEEKEKLFMPYFSTKREGRGLGLAIVHRIIDDHNGQIIGEDNLPEGTKFILLLPV
ncbi:MAG: HAMP domain-containing protein [bacterium]|nr:HAMP domain-containing protein [bacterium]